jgi:hypothetical protein
MVKRKDKRLQAKLYVRLKYGSITAQGLIYDVSENGLCINSSRDFEIGTVIDVELFMSSMNALVKGIIRRKHELIESNRKYGLGVEIIEKDVLYRHFVASLLEKQQMELVNE